MEQTILKTLRQELLTRAPLDAVPESVWKREGALNTWGTNAIEGNTLDRREVERVLLEQRSVPGSPIRDVIETIQHARAFEDLLNRRASPIRLSTVLELHEAVFRGILPDAGQWRRVNVRITGVRHAPPRMEKVIPASAASDISIPEQGGMKLHITKRSPVHLHTLSLSSRIRSGLASAANPKGAPIQPGLPEFAVRTDR